MAFHGFFTVSRHLLAPKQALRDSLEQEEQLGELLRARLWALEQASSMYITRGT